MEITITKLIEVCISITMIIQAILIGYQKLEFKTIKEVTSTYWGCNEKFAMYLIKKSADSYNMFYIFILQCILFFLLFVFSFFNINVGFIYVLPTFLFIIICNFCLYKKSRKIETKLNNKLNNELNNELELEQKQQQQQQQKKQQQDLQLKQQKDPMAMFKRSDGSLIF